MSKFIFFTAAAAAAVFLSACAQNKAKFSGRIDDEPAPVTSTAKVGGDAGETKRVAPTFPSQPKAATQAASGDPRQVDSLLSKRLVYFDFNKSVISIDQLAIIESHSDYLSRNLAQGVILEGHADERGSNEYNLALGQRRSDAVRDIMLANGVSQEQIETISFGEESPRALGHTEDAWKENRRVEIRYRDE